MKQIYIFVPQIVAGNHYILTLENSNFSSNKNEKVFTALK